MKIITEESLYQFEFWCGAKGTASLLTQTELEIIEYVLMDAYPDGLTATEINDIFWFDSDWIAEVIGYHDFDDLWKDRYGEIIKDIVENDS